MGRLVTAALWLAEASMTEIEVAQQIRDTFHISLRPEQVEEALRDLSNGGTVIRSSPDAFRLAEHVLPQLRDDLSAAEEVESRAKDGFRQAVEAQCPDMDADQLWRDFNDRMLLPTVATIGARSYDLVTGGYRDIDSIITLKAFLGRYPEPSREALRRAVGQFLDPTDPDVRAYILRHMSAYFLVEASSLSQATVDGLTELAGQQPSFVAFADTNFVFSILGLHAEHVNEAARQLVDLIASVSPGVDVKLYILPPTISEMHAALEMERDELTDVHWTPNIARGALESGALGDVGRHFAAACSRANRALDPRDYFEPYISNPVATLRAHGLELFNANFDPYQASAAVEKDVQLQIAAQDRAEGRSKRSRTHLRAPAKSKVQIRHDTMLWHFVHDKRPARVDSPLDAKFWILTEDYRFIGFDTAKRGRAQDDVPICVHPLVLIQMLQFWVGRTPELEQALVGSLRMSFLFQPFDANAERVTVRILERLSAYEDAHDLPQPVITATLLNQAIRHRIERKPSEREEATIIQEAIATEFKRISDTLTADRNRMAAEREAEARARREAEERKEFAARQVDTLTERLVATEAALEQTEFERDAEKRARADVERRVAGLEKQRELDARRHEIRKFLLVGVLAPGLMALIGGTASAWLYYIFRTDLVVTWWKLVVATCLLVVLGMLFYVDRRGSRNEVVLSWEPFRYYHAAHRWLYVVPVTGIIINFASDWLQRLTK